MGDLRCMTVRTGGPSPVRGRERFVEEVSDVEWQLRSGKRVAGFRRQDGRRRCSGDPVVESSTVGGSCDVWLSMVTGRLIFVCFVLIRSWLLDVARYGGEVDKGSRFGVWCQFKEREWWREGEGKAYGNGKWVSWLCLVFFFERKSESGKGSLLQWVFVLLLV